MRANLNDGANRPLVLGHRGASAIAPENTMASFQKARELGADGVELDVMLSRDGVPVVIHDDTVDRTTDGHGLVRRKSLLELKRLDAGSYKGEAYQGEQIPTLAEVLDGLMDWLNPVGATLTPRGVVNIELKSDSIGGNGLEREVANLIAQKNVEDAVIVSSFNPLALRRLRTLDTRLPRGLLYAADLPVYLSRAWFRFLAAPRAMHPEHSMIGPAFMQWTRGKRLAVNTWTVDDPEEAKRLAWLGVSAIISNRPDIIRRAVES